MADDFRAFPDWPPYLWGIGGAVLLAGICLLILLHPRVREQLSGVAWLAPVYGAWWGWWGGLAIGFVLLLGWGIGERESSNDDSGRSDSGSARECASGYSGCLDADASDYDCSGGTGDGPRFTGTVSVTGSDPFGLDADGDGVGCE
jgi:hypothetical protein